MTRGARYSSTTPVTLAEGVSIERLTPPSRLFGANGITVYRSRLFVNECRVGGRLVELPLDGSTPHILQDNLPMPNAMEVGPDGLLYYPVMGTNDRGNH